MSKEDAYITNEQLDERFQALRAEWRTNYQELLDANMKLQDDLDRIWDDIRRLQDKKSYFVNATCHAAAQSTSLNL